MENHGSTTTTTTNHANGHDRDHHDNIINNNNNNTTMMTPPMYDVSSIDQQENGGNGVLSFVSIDDAIERVGMGRFQHWILLAAGLCFAADSMEILLLTFLAVVLRAEWSLSETQTSTITSSVFIGALCGTIILGPAGDQIGRKPIFTITAAIITIAGFATAITNHFITLLLCRFFVGFGVGGLTVPFDTLAEFVPDSHRGSNLLLIEYFWTFGTLLVPVVAMLTLRQGGDAGDHDNGEWRVFVIWCAIPCLFSTLLGLYVVPESPRWLLTQGKNDEALAVLRNVATTNGKNPNIVFPPGTKIVASTPTTGSSNTHDDDHEAAVAGPIAIVQESHDFMDLLSPKWRWISLTLWGTWAGLAIVYYGTIIVVTMVFASAGDDNDIDNQEDGSYSFDYRAIVASASSEVAGVTLGIWLIDKFGRVPAQSVSYVGGGICVLMLCILAQRDEDDDMVIENEEEDGGGGSSSYNGGSSRASKLIMAFCSRMFFMSGTSGTWVHTAEILTTEIRTTGHSAANAIARICGSFSPFLVSTKHSYTMIGISMFCISIIVATFAFHLPETKGISMGQHNNNSNLDGSSSSNSDNNVVGVVGTNVVEMSNTITTNSQQQQQQQPASAAAATTQPGTTVNGVGGDSMMKTSQQYGLL